MNEFSENHSGSDQPIVTHLPDLRSVTTRQLLEAARNGNGSSLSTVLRDVSRRIEENGPSRTPRPQDVALFNSSVARYEETSVAEKI